MSAPGKKRIRWLAGISGIGLPVRFRLRTQCVCVCVCGGGMMGMVVLHHRTPRRTFDGVLSSLLRVIRGAGLSEVSSSPVMLSDESSDLAAPPLTVAKRRRPTQAPTTRRKPPITPAASEKTGLLPVT